MSVPSPAPSSDEAHPGELPLELILARSLVSIISVAAALIDVRGHVVFYNDAAAEIIGTRFEDTGPLTREQWNADSGPFDEHGRPVPYDELPLTVAVREGRPSYARFQVRSERGLILVEAGALPLLGPAGYHGAVILLWPVPEDDAT
jgi:PAS domain-containing protein